MKLSNAIKKKIKQNVKNSIKKYNALGKKALADDVNLYLYDESFEVNKEIDVLPDKKIRLEKGTAFVLKDMVPNSNWGHSCQHIFCDAETGKIYETKDANFPPAFFFNDREKFEAFHTPIKPTDIKKERKIGIEPIPGITNSLRNATGTRYAILFSGESDNRHVNDLEFLYRTLIDIYEFDPVNITVLNHDGTLNYNNIASYPLGNWPGDDTAYRIQVTGAGTRAALISALDDIAATLEEADFLLIHMNNHGYHNGQSYLVCYSAVGYDLYSASDFGDQLSTLPQFGALIVMMEQCFSGGFLDPIISNSPAKRTHVAAACIETESSWGWADFDFFAHDWIAAMNGNYPDGSALEQIVDTNADGKISAAESFTYADDVKYVDDTPVSAENPGGFGAYIYLGLPDHDLFVRDNLGDDGREPITGGIYYRSPDVIIFNDELPSPQDLASTANMDRDDLGEPVEFGQDNYIYLRIQNRGTQATSGTATLYWSHPSTFPTPAAWNLIDQIVIPSMASDDVLVVGPFIWLESLIPSPGHYCFIALIQSGDDPAPNPSMIQSTSDFYHFISDNNNAAWKNFSVVDVVNGGTNQFKFYIQNMISEEKVSNLEIDAQTFPENTNIVIQISSRLAESTSLEEAELIYESQRLRKFKINAGKLAAIKDLTLRKGENSLANITIELPENIDNGHYGLSIAQLIDNLKMGEITYMLAVGDYPFIANRNLREVHKNDCSWVEKIKNKHKVPYKDIKRALKHGYNGCQYCLPDFDTDNREAMMEIIEPILIDSFYEDHPTGDELEKLRKTEEKIVSSLKHSL